MAAKWLLGNLPCAEILPHACPRTTANQVSYMCSIWRSLIISFPYAHLSTIRPLRSAGAHLNRIRSRAARAAVHMLKVAARIGRRYQAFRRAGGCAQPTHSGGGSRARSKVLLTTVVGAVIICGKQCLPETPVRLREGPGSLLAYGYRNR